MSLNSHPHFTKEETEIWVGCIRAWSQQQQGLWFLCLPCTPQLVKYYPSRQGKQPWRAHTGDWNASFWLLQLAVLLTLFPLPLLWASGKEGDILSLYALSKRTKAGDLLESTSSGLPYTQPRKVPQLSFLPSPLYCIIPCGFFCAFFPPPLSQSKQTGVWIIDWEKLEWLTVLVGIVSHVRKPAGVHRWRPDASGSCPGGIAGAGGAHRALWHLAVSGLCSGLLVLSIKASALGKCCRILESPLFQSDLNHTRYPLRIHPKCVSVCEVELGV